MTKKRKIKLALIGIGTGNPDHITLEAIKVLQSSDLILLPSKGGAKQELLEARTNILDEHVSKGTERLVFEMPSRDPNIQNYLTRVEQWHDRISDIWKQAIDSRPKAQTVALLVWGDPSLYDSSLRIMARLEDSYKLQIHMVAGITAIQGLTAAHKIPLNSLGGAVKITTGRNLRDHGWPTKTDRIVVMLDGENSFVTLPDKHRYEIYWSAYVGMQLETHIRGKLSEVENQIIYDRERLRKKHGWIMDIYILGILKQPL